jgi:hypothetical protein
MQSTADSILNLTRAVAEAAAEGDYTRCDRLLAERGVALRRLSELHAASGGGEPAPEIRRILAGVKELDEELAKTWSEIRDRAGEELERIASLPKQKHGTEAPCILDRQA